MHHLVTVCWICVLLHTLHLALCWHIDTGRCFGISLSSLFKHRIRHAILCLFPFQLKYFSEGLFWMCVLFGWLASKNICQLKVHDFDVLGLAVDLGLLLLL